MILACHVTGQPMDGATWSIPKGLPDEGEDYAQAACRELFEETGIVREPKELLPVGGSPYYSESMKVAKTLIPFLAVYEGNGEDLTCICDSFFTDSEGKSCPEVDAFRWITQDEAKIMLHSSQVARLDYTMNVYKGIMNK